MTVFKQELPFTVSIVNDQLILRRVAHLRSEAYSRYYINLGSKLESPEQLDFHKDSVIFVAESKETHEIIGTIRLNLSLSGPIDLENSIDLPDEFTSGIYTGVSRFAVVRRPFGKLIQLSLFKAIYNYCINHNVSRMIIGARPPIDKTYIGLGFVDVYQDQELRSLRSADYIKHRILSLDIFSCESKWRTSRHRYYRFMFQICHPDINVLE